MTQTEIKSCPCCGHPMADELDLALTTCQREIFDAVDAAGTKGIHYERLRVRLYGNNPNGGPCEKLISTHVHNINNRLRRHNLKIKSKEYIYRLYNVV